MRPFRMWRPSRPVTAAAPQQPERRSFLKRLFAFTAGGAALAAIKPREARADNDPFVGEIALVGFNFAPTGWAFCNGQLLPINQNTALFSLLGTQYGGDGISTFALPDLRGRVPLHYGQGPGLSAYNIGQIGGVEAVTLSAAQMPTHAHTLNASSLNGTSDSPAAGFPAKSAAGVPQYGGSFNAAMAGTVMSNAGGNQAHENRTPFLAMNYIISLYGIFPSRP